VVLVEAAVISPDIHRALTAHRQSLACSPVLYPRLIQQETDDETVPVITNVKFGIPFPRPQLTFQLERPTSISTVTPASGIACDIITTTTVFVTLL
jgi:hypothetical protein